MMRCRICGSTKNLKYTPAEIRGSQKGSKRLPLPLKEIANAINGNICKFCDLRLENFHKEASPVEIDITDDERFCEMFYKKQYGPTEVANVRSLGSDGDPEVIEVLTSRETTPEKTFTETKQDNRQILSSNTRIIDVIDLEDDDESTDKVITTVNNQSSQIRKENLLGCLNLVTSDSESSEIQFEPCHKNNLRTGKTPTNIVVNNNIKHESGTAAEQTFPVCEFCSIRFLDTASLQVHMKDNHYLPCPVCELHFKFDLELLYHVRQKHRQYNSEKLFQGAPSPKDSAMTIRLRFHSSTFYECQLCGHIDTQFKDHKEHILQNHPDESKSLRDPIMKTKFSCPACHQKTGSHHVDVCRHLLLKHPEKYKKYIKEVTDLSTLPVKTTKAMQNIKRSARVLSLIGKNECFYECHLCKKIFGYLPYFLKHLNVHHIDEWTEYEKRKAGIIEEPYDCSIRSKRKTDEHKISNVKEKRTSLPKNKTDLESSQKLKQQTSRKSTTSKPAIKSKKQDGLFKKPLKQTITNVEAINIEPTTIDSKRQKKLKRRSKNDTTTAKGTTKVKVKAPLRHFPTQKYDCKHCQSTFKGFRKLNLHLMLTHSAKEFQHCLHCPHMFTSESANAHHARCSQAITLMPKRKRKLTSHSMESETFDENFNKEPPSKRPRLTQTKVDSTKLQNQNNGIQTEPVAWQKELYQLSRDKKENASNSDSIKEVQLFQVLSQTDKEQLLRTAHNVCRYCARLFAEPLELSTHEKQHTDAKDMPWIALKALTQN